MGQADIHRSHPLASVVARIALSVTLVAMATGCSRGQEGPIDVGRDFVLAVASGDPQELSGLGGGDFADVGAEELAPLLFTGAAPGYQPGDPVEATAGTYPIGLSGVGANVEVLFRDTPRPQVSTCVRLLQQEGSARGWVVVGLCEGD